jgi:outer membrane autotransporter protein
MGKANIWLQNYGLVQNMQGSSRGPGYKAQMGGFSAGGDYEIDNRTYVGAFGGLSTNPYDLKSHRGDGRLKSYYGGVYGVKMMDCGFYVDGQLMAGGDNYRTKRRINFSTINRTAKAHHNGGHLYTKAEFGQISPLSRFMDVSSRYDLMMQPFINVAYALAHENSFTEKGANSLNFRIKSRNSNFVRGEGGLLVYKTYKVCDTLLRPEFSLSYVNTTRVGGSRGRVHGGLIGQPQTLIVRGDNTSINQVAPEIGLTAQFKNGAYILANGRGELGGRLNTLSGVVTLGYNF